MVRKREEIEELIASYLSGEASPDQAMDLDAWRSENAFNESLYKAYEKTHYALDGSEAYKSVDVESAWDKIKGSIKDEAKIIPLHKNRRFYLSVAAIGLVAFIIGSIWNFDDTPNVVHVTTDPTKKVAEEDKERVIYASTNLESVTLRDQSVVELEQGSKLTLAKDYNNNGRNAELEGSGRFTVVHDETNPFILHVNELDVFDIGTIFSVDTKGDTVKVIVEEGAVELRLNGETIDMAEGDSAFYVISEQFISRYKTEESRKDKVFKFDDTSVKQAMHLLGEYFERDIVVKSEGIMDCEFSVTFTNKPLSLILDVIKELLDLEIIYNNKTIEIYGDSCE